MFKKILKNQLIAGSLVLFVGTLFANFASYLYHLLMGRMLGPVGYGELESVISVLYLLVIIATSLILVIAKFVADLKGKGNLPGVSFLFSYFTRQLILFGGLLLLLLVIISPLLASFLHLDSTLPLILASFSFFITLLLALNRGVLQGLMKFKELAVISICENGLKVIIAVILVFLGFWVKGAVSAWFLAGFITYVFALFLLKEVRRLSPQKPDFNKKKFVNFALPVLLVNLSFTSLYTTDIILVKHFFSPHEAGLYAALTILGKIVFFASSPISMVMFPMVVDHHARGRDYRHLLFVSLVLVFLICLGIEVVFFLFPKLMVFLLFGKDFLAAVPLVGWMGIFLSIYSLSYLFANFFLSLERTKSVFFPIIASLGQIILIYFFHNSLFQVIQVSILTSGLLLLSLMLYYRYDKTKASLGHHSRL